MAQIKSETATIAENGTVSSAVEVNGYTLCGIAAPACVGTSVSISVDSDGSGTYIDAYTADGTQITATVSGTARYIALDPVNFATVHSLKLTSNGTETSAITFRLLFRHIT